MPVPRKSSKITRSRLAISKELPWSSLSRRRFSVSVRNRGGVRGSLCRASDAAGFFLRSSFCSAHAKKDRIAALKRCMDARDLEPPLADCVTSGEVNAASIMALVTLFSLIPGCRTISASAIRERSRRYALTVLGDRPSASRAC